MSVLIVLLLCNGFTLFFPGEFTASGFLTTYLGIPLFLFFYLAHKLTVGRKDRFVYRPEDADLTTNIREVEADAQMWTQMEAMEKTKSGKQNFVLQKLTLIWQ